MQIMNSMWLCCEHAGDDKKLLLYFARHAHLCVVKIEMAFNGS